MLHEHKFPLPLWEREKKVQQRAVKGSMSGWERRGRVAGRRRPEWQRADEESLPFARLVDRSHFVVQASSPAFGAGQRPAPQALIKLFLPGSLSVQLSEAVEVVELGDEVLREIR